MPSSKAKQQRWNIRKKRYPKNWAAIKAKLRERSGGQCECTGECGNHIFERCVEKHGQEGITMKGVVYLQAMHLNHQPEDTRLEIMMDGCPGCHLRYDKLHHATNARQTKNKEKGQIDCIDHMTEQEAISMLLASMESQKMKSGLVPAPEQNHSGHMVRVVFERPPRWYCDLAAARGYHGNRQGLFRREHFINALKRIQGGLPAIGYYGDVARAIIRKAIEVPEEVFCV